MPLIAYRLTRVSSRRTVGQVIEPGDFGRAVLGLGAHALRESVLETVRVRAYPMAVSRLAASFAWASEKHAHAYLDGEDAGEPEELWEVEIAANTPVTRADVMWLAGSEDHDAEHWRTVAPSYWSGQPKEADRGVWELVIGGAIRLRRRLAVRHS